MEFNESFSDLGQTFGSTDFSSQIPCHFYLTADYRQAYNVTFKLIQMTSLSAKKEHVLLPAMQRQGCSSIGITLQSLFKYMCNGAKLIIYSNSILCLLIVRVLSIPKVVFRRLFLALNLIWGTQVSFLTMGLMKRIKETNIFCVSYISLPIINISFAL